MIPHGGMEFLLKTCWKQQNKTGAVALRNFFTKYCCIGKLLQTIFCGNFLNATAPKQNCIGLLLYTWSFLDQFRIQLWKFTEVSPHSMINIFVYSKPQFRTVIKCIIPNMRNRRRYVKVCQFLAFIFIILIP